MPSRRPPQSVDAERLMKRVEGRIDAAFDAMLKALGEVQQQIGATEFEVRKGNQAREQMAQRLSDLEMQVIETRSHLQISDREGLKRAEEVAGRVQEAAVSVAAKAPKDVWRTKIAKFVAGCVGFVAVVAAINNLPRFVRESSHIVVGIYDYIISRPGS
jgi:hypothetical protein